jgi:lectin, mannose-binding 2
MYNEAALTISHDRYKNDFHSERSFPRIVAMQGDGKTSYDLANDGASNVIGECTVRTIVYGALLRFQQTVQVNFRGSSVATKLKVIYVKDKVLDVRRSVPS